MTAYPEEDLPGGLRYVIVRDGFTNNGVNQDVKNLLEDDFGWEIAVDTIPVDDDNEEDTRL